MSEKVKSRSVFELDGVPSIGKTIPLSLQHILAMIVGTVTVPIIVAGACGVVDSGKTLMVQYALIIAGITTILQLYPIGNTGSKLPIIFGVGFTYVPTLTAIGAVYGLEGVLGAQLVGGVATIVVGLFLKKLRKYFPNVVAGTVVLTIGLSLYPIAINYMAGGIGNPTYGEPKHWILAMITLIVVIGFSQFGKGYVKLAAIFMGIVVGYTIAILFGMVDFTAVQEANWFAIPKPFEFGIKFHMPAVISMVVISIVNSIQAIGDLSATTIGGMNREISDKELSNGVVGCGICTVLGSIFGALPPSSYSQNVGIVAMTKVISRFVLGIAAVFMLLCGFIPKFGALMTTIPYSVLGGATITVFSMIAMTGIKLITTEELSSRNIMIVGLSVALGMGITSVPESLVYFSKEFVMIFGQTPIVIAAIVAFVLNIILPKKSLDDEAKERAEMEKSN